jgi:serine phosphatase RsbU (regulator of sigma subunit)
MVYLKRKSRFIELQSCMRTIKIQLIFIFCFFAFFADASSTDSLKAALKNDINDTTRCNILNSLIEEEEDDNVWGAYNEEVKTIAENNLKSLTKGTPLYIFYSKCLAGAYNNRGYIAKFHGNIPQALDNYHRSLQMYEDLNDQVNIANVLNNLGFIYREQGDNDKALRTFLRNLEQYKKTKNTFSYGWTLNNIGIIYSDQGNLQKALEYYQQCLEVQKELKNKKLEAYVLNNIGEVYEQRSNRDPSISKGKRIELKERALDHFKRSLALQEEVGDRRGISLSLGYIALTLVELDKAEEARGFAERGLQVATEAGYTDNIGRSSEALGKIYAKIGNWKSAYEMQVLFKKMSDSIANETNKKMSIQKSFQYEYDKKATADSVKAFQERKVFDAQLKQEKTQRMALYFGIILVGVFGAFMFNRFKITKKQNQLIRLQKTELQSQKDLVEAHQKETLDSIHYAKRIQSALIANSDLITRNIGNNFIYFNPKDIVSGDFYWATDHNGKFFLAVCDSTGHGVPGAFMSLLNIGFLSEAIKEKNIEKPNDVFNYVRQRLITSISEGGQRDGMDGILICIDRKTKTIEYAAANNEPVLVRDKKIIDLPKDKMPVGHAEDLVSFKLHSFSYTSGDMLYMYTDGFADQFGGPNGKKYKYRQLNELLINLCDKKPETQKGILESEFLTWKGDLEQVDDVCIVGLHL